MCALNGNVMNGTTVRDIGNLTVSAGNRADYLHISMLCSAVVRAESTIVPRGLPRNTVWAVTILRDLGRLAREGRSEFFLFCYNLS